MFRFIELLGLTVLLWFIANFIHYIVYQATGFGGDTNNWLFGMSTHWIKQEKMKQEKESQTGRRKK